MVTNTTRLLPLTDESLSRRDRAKRADGGNPTNHTSTMIHLLAEISGSIQGAFGCLAAAIGVGLVGAKAVEGVGRNPGASGKILVQSIIGMALAEAVAFYALFLGK
jgi:F-type H+-transporting ATPase subunit c